jgi:glutathione S-transferase
MLKRFSTVTVGFLLAMVIMAAPLEAVAKAKWPTTKSSGEPMLTIYHIEGRRSERIIWFCEEVGLPYKLVFKPGDPPASMELIKQVNPLMAIAPTVQLGDEVMVESAAILQLLQERYAPGKLEPAHDSPDYPKYLQWLHFAEGSAAPRLSIEFLLTSVKGGQMPPVAQSQIGKAAQTLTYMEDYLTRHPYFGGQEFSLADIMMHFNLQFVNVVTHTDMTPYPKLTAWYAKIQERAAFKKMRQVALPNGLI